MILFSVQPPSNINTPPLLRSPPPLNVFLFISSPILNSNLLFNKHPNSVSVMMRFFFFNINNNNNIIIIILIK